MSKRPHVVIIGGGFGGLQAAKALKRAPVKVTLIDRRNFHLFQPLLYQVATGGLSPGDIASPLRAILRRQQNTQVLLGDVVRINVAARHIVLADREEIPFDYLIVATGVRHDYFGHDSWAHRAPGLKTIEDATNIRSRIFTAFEAAERESDRDRQQALLTFVIVGGGPTGVELAGAIGEIAHLTLRGDFRRVTPADARILLVEGGPRILSAYTPNLSVRAERALRRLGVTTLPGSVVTDVDDNGVTVTSDDGSRRIPAATVIWAAGVRATTLARDLIGGKEDRLDKSGRVKVRPDLGVPDLEDIFVIGDLAHMRRGDHLLPGLCPVAMQQGRYVAKLIEARVGGRPTPGTFRYIDRGMLAVIGRAAAVAMIGPLRVWGYPAWLLWLFVHIMYLVEFDNRLLVFIQWGWNYFTKNRGARLITDSAHASAGKP